MKGTAVILFVAAVLAASNPVSVQGQSSATLDKSVKLSPRFVYVETRLFLRDGSVVWGRLKGADSDSIWLRQADENLAFSRKEIVKIVIEPPKRPSRGIIPGAVLGLYVGNGLLGMAKGTPDSGRPPGFYLGHGSGDFPGGILGIMAESFFAGAGGGLGWLVGSAGGKEVFALPADPDKGQAIWGRFLDCLGGTPAPAKLHVRILGGPVDLRVSRSFDAAVRDAGFSASHVSSWASNFSILRGFQVDYSLGSRLQAGLRISFTGEPFRWSVITGENEEEMTLMQRFGATVFHGVLSVEPLNTVLPWFMSWNAGLGAGVAAVRLGRQSTIWIPSPSSRIQEDVENRKVLPSAILFSTLEFRVTDILSLGFATDLTFIPAGPFPALPDAGLPGQKIGLSNASAGFVIGYHF